MAHPEFGKGDGGTTEGLGVKPLAANELLRFQHKKNTHSNTLFYQTRLAVSAIIMDNAKIFLQLVFKSSSSVKISEKRLQTLLV